MIPVLTTLSKQLWYPLQYEGLECSKYVFYFGATPNQQIHPAIDWLTSNVGTSFFLVGSDYVFPRSANAIVRSKLQWSGSRVTGEMYIPLTSANVTGIISSIFANMSTGGIIINTLNGDANVAFFRALYNETQARNMTGKFTVMSFSVSETEAAAIGSQYLTGHYAAWNYLQTLNTTANNNFVANFRRRFGSSRVVSDPTIQAYTMVKMWAEAVKKAGSFDQTAVEAALIGLTVESPGGNVTMTNKHHTVKTAYIGRFNSNGLLDLVHSTSSLQPFPWDTFLESSQEYECNWADATKGEKFKVDVVRVGVLHSLTGPMAISEIPVVQAELTALDILNARLITSSRRIIPVLQDGQSTPSVFAQRAESLLMSNISVVFGGWTSSSRRAMIPIFERYNALLFYPVQYEGQECSKNVFYGGALPNQQLNPSLVWAMRNLNNNFFLVGSDYVYPRTANSIARSLITSRGGTVTGEEYFDLSATDLGNLTTRIRAAMPSGGVIVNTLNGASNIDFFNKLSRANMSAATWPSLSMSIGEAEVPTIGSSTAGHYVAWNYLQSMRNNNNNDFLSIFQARYGRNTVVNDPMEAAFILVRMWGNVFSSDPTIISSIDRTRTAMYGQRYSAPEGDVTMFTSHHLSKWPRVGRIESNYSISVVFEKMFVETPEPWSLYINATLGYQCDWSNPSRGGQYRFPYIKVGVLHSFTGAMASSERSVVDATLLAISEINRDGGIMGYQIIPELADGQSNVTVFQQQANALADKGVTTVFGCWTSASRVAVAPVMASRGLLLWYPLQYEGEECNRNVFYGGSVPDQQILPAVNFAIRTVSLQSYLIGSDYLFPRTANAIIRAILTRKGGVINGEAYLSLTATDAQVAAAVAALKTAMPLGGVIYNTLNGDSNTAFFRTLASLNMTAPTYTVMSFSVAEAELASIGVNITKGHFASWSYFMSLNSAANNEFLKKFASEYGSSVLVSDPMEAAYSLVNLWKQAAASVRAFDTESIRQSAYGLVFRAPQGTVKMGTNHHISKYVRIGQALDNGQFRIVYQRSKATAAQPWSFWYNSTDLYGCDYNDAIKGTKYKMDAVKIGALFSYSGSSSSTERDVSEFVLSLFEDINSAGGVLGRQIVPIVEDGASSTLTFTSKATALLARSDVQTVFGTWSSASRAAVKPVVEQFGKLLYYPARYEGQECSSNILYFGGAANTVLEPALYYILRKLQLTRVFHFGSSDAFSQQISAIASAQLATRGASMAGESLVTLGSAAVDDPIKLLLLALPNGGAILNTAVDETTQTAFVSKLQAALMKFGYTAQQAAARWPIMFLRMDQQQARRIGAQYLAGHYGTWNYYTTLDTGTNQDMTRQVQDYLGSSYLGSDDLETAYIMVNAWKQAAERAVSFDAPSMLSASRGLSLQAPQGTVRIGVNHHANKVYRVGRVSSSGGFDIVFERKVQLSAEPWSQYVESTRGYMCDWSDAKRSGFFKPPTIEVGVLHSFTGPMAISEVKVVDAELLAIDETNDAGGVLGYRVLPRVADGASDPARFATELQNLLNKNVSIVFGGWTSSSRKAMLPVIEASPKLLFYPLQYEGQECSKNVFYFGAAPNQQLIPALKWLLRNKGRTFYLIGSDYVFPRTANAIAQAFLSKWGGIVVKEKYVDLSAGFDAVDAVVQDIQQNLPDGGIVLNTLNGQANVYFFQQMNARLLPPERYPVMSLSVSENEVDSIGKEFLKGHYAAWNYIETLDTDESARFKQSLQGLHGSDYHVSDPLNSAYEMVQMWRLAASKARSFGTDAVSSALFDLPFLAPEGNVTMRSSHHLSKPARIGQFTAAGSMTIVHSADYQIQPQPWSQDLDATAGYGCDWSDPVSKGMKYLMDVVSVGILHSTTGTMALSEQTVIDAEMLAIEEINESGGVNGKTILPIIANGASDPSVFAQRASELMNRTNLQTVFGCWTSASRKAVKPIFEAANRLLWYPVQYEGQECSKNIFYGGQTPNQQIIPTLDWTLGQGVRTYYLVGSDYVFPRTANAIIRNYLTLFNATIVGESYLPLGSTAVIPILRDIMANLPKKGIILNTLNGDSNVAFFQAMSFLRMTASDYPTMSFSIGEPEVSAIGVDNLVGHYAAWSYFHTLSSPVRDRFVRAMKSRYGESTVTSDAAEAAYNLVQLWRQAASKAQSFQADAVRMAAYNTAVNAPQGALTMRTDHHFRKLNRIGKVRADGLFDIVFSVESPLDASPWSAYVPGTDTIGCDWSVPSRGGNYSVDAVPVGIIHSLSGTMAISETSVLQASLMAIQKINDAGGVLGKAIRPVIVDGKSDPAEFARQAGQLLARNVTTVFGGWTSSSRKAMLPVFEAANGLLYYPLQYEANECSYNIFYGGATPNQQLLPAIKYMVDRYPDKAFFLVGSDYVFPRTANAVAKEYLNVLGVPFVNELYIALGNKSVDFIVDSIAQLLPAGGIILNTLNGDSNVAFFQKLKARNFTALTHPSISLSIGEPEIPSIGVDNLVGHYAAWNYFQTVNSAENKAFVASYQARYGQQPVSDPMEAAFILINLWKQAVETAKSFQVDRVRRAMYGQSFLAPEGQVTMTTSHHLSKFIRIGQVQADGTLAVKFTRARAETPEPWSPLQASTRGYGCDWSDRVKRGGFYAMDTVQVGILHSMTGAWAATERALQDAEAMAIRHINENALLSKVVVPVYANGFSNYTSIRARAREFAANPQIVAVFAGGSSEARQIISDELPNTLLFYPKNYEGQECRTNVLYGGLVPNQFLQPALSWALASLSSSYIFVSCDGRRYDNTVTSLAKSYVSTFGGSVLTHVLAACQDAGSTPLNGSSWAAVASSFAAYKSAVIVNTMDAVRSAPFLTALSGAGLSAAQFPVMSFAISETDVSLGYLNASVVQGHYLVGSYFSGIDSNSPGSFLYEYQGYYGTDRLPGDEMQSAYALLRLWAQAAFSAKQFNMSAIRNVAPLQFFDTPAGAQSLEDNGHSRKRVRVAQFDSSGRTKVVVDYPVATSPDPWSDFTGNGDGNVMTCDLTSSSAPGLLQATTSMSATPRAISGVKVVVIAPLSGAQADESTQDRLAALITAVKATNANGGLLGKQVQVVVRDCQSSAARAAQLLESAVVDSGVVGLFGWGERNLRVAMTDRLAALGSKQVLYWGSDHSGEYNKQTVFFGREPRLLLQSTIAWMITKLGLRSFFVIASSADSPAVLSITTAAAQGKGGSVFGSYQYDMGGNATALWTAVATACPNGCTIINYLNYKILAPALTTLSANFSSLTNTYMYPTFYFQVSERQLASLGKVMARNYLVSNYFSSMDVQYNTIFRAAISQATAGRAALSHELQATYNMVNVWANAVVHAGSFDPTNTRLYALALSVETPQGTLKIRSDNQQTFKPMVGQILDSLSLKLFSISSSDSLAERSNFDASKESYYFGPAQTIYKYSVGVSGAVWACGAINAAMLLVFMFIVVFQHNRPAIKSASVPFCLLILLSLMCLDIAGVLFGVEPSGTNNMCVTRVWLLSMSLCATFSLLFAKTWRLFKIFTNPKLKVVAMPNFVLIMRSVPVMLANIIILCVWSGTSAPSYDLDFSKEMSTTYIEDIYVPVCTSNTLFMGLEYLYFAVILIIGTVMAYYCRRLPERFNEAPYIFVCISFMLIFSIIMVPINYIIGNNPEALVVLRGLGIQVAVTIMACALFVPKFLNMDLSNGVSTESGSTNRSNHSGVSTGSTGAVRLTRVVSQTAAKVSVNMTSKVYPISAKSGSRRSMTADKYSVEGDQP